MNLFKQRRPKRFRYIPRHLREGSENKPDGFDAQWHEMTRRKRRTLGLPGLIIIFAVVIVLWFVLSHYENR